MMRNLDWRHVEGSRQQIVRQRGVQKLAGVIEDKLLVKCIANSLRDATMNLAVNNHRVDNGAAVMHDDVSLYLDHHRFWIDFDDDSVSSTCSRTAFRTEIAGCFQSGLAPGLNGTAKRISFFGELAKTNGMHPHSGDRYSSTRNFQVTFCAFELLSRKA